jgi:hypothetical protein
VDAEFIFLACREFPESSSSHRSLLILEVAFNTLGLFFSELSVTVAAASDNRLAIDPDGNASAWGFSANY